MKILWIQAFVLLLCILYAAVVLAQGERKLYNLNLPENDSIKNTFLEDRQVFLEERLHQPFPLLGLRETIDHTMYDFDQPGRYRIIEFGFSDCPPCRGQLPYFIALSNDKRYAGIGFLYVSYNDSATIMKDIVSLYHGRHDRLKIFSFDRDYLTFSSRLTHGYPSLYFINNNRLVQAIMIGGWPAPTKDQEQEFKAKWTRHIDSLLCY